MPLGGVRWHNTTCSPKVSGVSWRDRDLLGVVKRLTERNTVEAARLRPGQGWDGNGLPSIDLMVAAIGL